MKLVGVACGEHGPTHHSVEDFSWLRPLVPLIVITPASPCEVEQAIRRAAAHDGAVCNRLSGMPFAGAVAELTAASRPVPLERLGFPGVVSTGSVNGLFNLCGLPPDGIAAAAHRTV